MAQPGQSSSKGMMQYKNVAGGPLAVLSKDPPAGFYRDGYCRTGPDDKGNHSVGATVNQEFLDFTNSRGNNLREAGVEDGMKWCLCAHRWKEAFDAAQKGELAKSGVPRVHLHASHEKALDRVKYGDLSKYAAQGEAPNQLRNRQDVHHNPESPSGIARETTELSGSAKPQRTGG